MKNKSYENLLYSTLGVVFVAFGLVALNVIAGALKYRADLTKEKAYTLSDGTKAILRKLDTPVKIRFYYTQGEATTADSVFLKGYARQVKDLLSEYKQIAKGKLTIEEYDPEPDSDVEDSAHLDGVDGQMLRTGEKFYLGLCVDMLGEKQTIAFLDPNRERLLEYDLSRAITRVGAAEKPVVGIMSPLPLFGMPANPMMARMGQGGGGQPAWAIVTELQRDFTVKHVGMDVEKIDDDIKALIVIHPRDLADKAQFAIDQFVLRGGKLMAYLDPLPAIVDTKEQNQMFGNIPNTGSSMEKLLKTWGLSFDVAKVVADTQNMLPTGQPGQHAPAILRLAGDGLNKDDVLTSQIDSVWLPFAGAFIGTPAAGLKETVLLRSSTQSQLVDGFMANLSGENILKDFKPSGTRYALAVRLNGKFKTAFPAGKPEDKKDDQKKDDAKPADKKPDDALKESTQENAVILVGDADFLGDGVAVERVQTIFGTQLVQRNGNLSFAQNGLEQLTGDSNLIAVRSRATLDYPLEEIQKMEAKAIEASQSEINQMQEKVADAQKKINELQQAKKDKDQRFVLSPEQAAELANLRKEEANTNKKLKQLKKDTRRQIVSRENFHKWMDILAVPLAVSLSGIMIAVVKSRKTSAK